MRLPGCGNLPGPQVREFGCTCTSGENALVGVRLVGSGGRALQLMHRVVIRQRAHQGGGVVSDDHTMLVRLLAHLEVAPHPRGWFARLRHAWDIRQARSMVDWEDARHEGPAFFIQTRNTLAVGWTFMWIGMTASALFFRHRPLTLARVGLLAGFSVILFGFGFWYLKALPARFFRHSEQRYLDYVERARALPAPTGRPDPQAAV